MPLDMNGEELRIGDEVIVMRRGNKIWVGDMQDSIGRSAVISNSYRLSGDSVYLDFGKGTRWYYSDTLRKVL